MSNWNWTRPYLGQKKPVLFWTPEEGVTL
jgi:hypothetical protein